MLQNRHDAMPGKNLWEPQYECEFVWFIAKWRKNAYFQSKSGRITMVTHNSKRNHWNFFIFDYKKWGTIMNNMNDIQMMRKISYWSKLRLHRAYISPKRSILVQKNAICWTGFHSNLMHNVVQGHHSITQYKICRQPSFLWCITVYAWSCSYVSKYCV